MNATSRTTAAAAILLPIALLVLLLGAIAADPHTSCATPVGTSPGGPTGQTLEGMTEAQLRLARDGVVIGKQRRMPDSVIIAELAAQGAESGFRNLANPSVPESLSYPHDGLGHDHDSIGPHQLRAGVWGSVGVAELMNPVYQINWFYDRAEQSGAAAQHLSPAELAQHIEQSAVNAYAGHIELARELYQRFADIDLGTASSAPAGAAATGCGSGGGSMSSPAEASAFGRAVIEHASRWIGTPYVWGGGDVDGPTGGGVDCSGLTLYAIYHASGRRIRLPHYTQAQQDHPSAVVVPFERRQPGDLIFFTSPGDSDSHHVGIYLGPDDQGRDQLLHAPQSGQTVTTTLLSGFAGERMDVRRYEVRDPAGVS